MKKLIAAFLFSAVIFTVYGYDVDREELERNKKEVEFVNYTGTHEKIDTRDEIYSIGTSLGQDIKGRQNASLSGKYRILHLVDPTEPDKMGADIFILEKNANVDHIRNLRLILSAYLKTAYGYSDSDSSLLAEFVTYYNAVFRGNISWFESKYNNMVLVNITAENAGIDIHYKNWPGKTRMIIPLKNGETGESPALSSKELSEKEVIEDLRKNKDRGIEPRKEMVELREKELDRELVKSSEKEEKAAAEKDKVSEEKEKVEEKIKELEGKKEAGTVPDDKYEEEKSKLEKEKEELAEEESDLEKEIEKAKKQTAEIEKEKAAVSEEREVIASDTNKILENEAGAGETPSVTGEMRKPKDTFFIRVLEDSSGRYGEAVLIDNKTGKIGGAGSVKKTGIRGFLENRDGSSILITGSDNGSDFYLMKIDTNNLEIKTKSDNKVYRDTVINENRESVFAVIQDNGNFKIGKFSSSLALESFSDENALPDTFIFHDADNKNIYFQNSDGEITALDSSTMAAAK